MKIAILADVHLGLPETQFPGQSFEFTPDLLRLAVQQIVQDAAERVMVVGDLVNMGTAAEFRLANELLAPLAGRVRTIPGNHDLIDATLGEFSVRLAGAAVNEVVEHEGLIFVLLNSAIEKLPVDQWHGRVGPAALAALDRARAVAGQRPIVVMAHHPPAGTVRTLDYPMMSLVNGQPLLDRLYAHPAEVVLFTGHNHSGDVWRNRNLTIVSCPSLAFWPHAYILAEWSGGVLRLRERQVIDSSEHSPHRLSRSDASFRRQSESVVPGISIRLMPS